MFNFLRKTSWFKLTFFPDCTGPCYYFVLACTQALFYFSFRSFRNTGKRARASARKKNSPGYHFLSGPIDGLQRENRGFCEQATPSGLLLTHNQKRRKNTLAKLICGIDLKVLLV